MCREKRKAMMQGHAKELGSYSEDDEELLMGLQSSESYVHICTFIIFFKLGFIPTLGPNVELNSQP